MTTAYAQGQTTAQTTAPTNAIKALGATSSRWNWTTTLSLATGQVLHQPSPRR